MASGWRFNRLCCRKQLVHVLCIRWGWASNDITCLTFLTSVSKSSFLSHRSLIMEAHSSSSICLWYLVHTSITAVAKNSARKQVVYVPQVGNIAFSSLLSTHNSIFHFLYNPFVSSKREEIWFCSTFCRVELRREILIVASPTTNTEIAAQYLLFH